MAEFRITAHKRLNTVRVKCKLGNKMMSGWDILHYLKNAKGLSCVEELLLKTEKDFGEKPSIYENYICICYSDTINMCSILHQLIQLCLLYQYL